MTAADREQAIFGGGDGLSSAIGLIAALAISGAATLLTAAIALAVGAAVSMGLNEWLADPQSRVHRAAVMGAATLAGSIAPAVPYVALGGLGAAVACAAVTVGCGSVIAELRPGARAPSYCKTFGVLVVACGAAVLASRLAGGVG